jgi:hypothetical protein
MDRDPQQGKSAPSAEVAKKAMAATSNINQMIQS